MLRVIEKNPANAHDQSMGGLTKQELFINGKQVICYRPFGLFMVFKLKGEKYIRFDFTEADLRSLFKIYFIGETGLDHHFFPNQCPAPPKRLFD